MKLTDTILFSLAVALFIIGVHQTFTVGLVESYWLFMFCLGLLFVYQLRKKPETKEPLPPPGKGSTGVAVGGGKQKTAANASRSKKPGRATRFSGKPPKPARP
ncbi:MAG: hypothetical protein H7Z75_02515 [Ferruginibacter sp.]|nr:hypothetical protein [Cytophagales bacterium]